MTSSSSVGTLHLLAMHDLQRRLDSARCVLVIASSPHTASHAWHSHAVVFFPRPPLFFADCADDAIAEEAAI